MALVGAGGELRFTPSLVASWPRVVASASCYSGTRLRNAAGWPAG